MEHFLQKSCHLAGPEVNLGPMKTAELVIVHLLHSFQYVEKFSSKFRLKGLSLKVLISLQTESTDRVLGKMGLGVPESVLVEYQVIHIKSYWCFSSFFL